jgi:hypothetical protein
MNTLLTWRLLFGLLALAGFVGFNIWLANRPFRPDPLELERRLW